MVATYGEPVNFTDPEPVEETWPDCITPCLGIWDCVAVQATLTGCAYFKMRTLYSVAERDEESDMKIAFKVVIGRCPPKNSPDHKPPLFAQSSRPVIVTDNTNYYKSEFIETGDGFWKFSYSIHKCLTDIPENYEPLVNIEKRYVYDLSAPFLPGEMFFMKGKISDCECNFSISFFCNIVPKFFALYIKVMNGMFGEFRVNFGVEASVWNKTEEGDVIFKKEFFPNPYNHGDEFVIRVNSSETQAFIFLDDKEVITFDLLEEFPISKIDKFIINDSNADHESVVVDYIGWSGECWYEPW